MTPEQIHNAEAEIRKWFPPQTEAETPIWRRALDMLVATAKAAIPSGRVAKDVEMVRSVLGAFYGKAEPHQALDRLATKAQSAETWRGMWIESESGRNALLAERDRLKDAGTALMRESNARLDRAERAERALLRAGFEDHGGEEWAPPLGAAPTHYKTTGEPRITPDELAAMGADGGLETTGPRGDPPGWTLRDEFAKAAMHAYLTHPRLTMFMDDATAMRRAYNIAEAMMRAREEK
jgi:hypothetical protein